MNLVRPLEIRNGRLSTRKTKEGVRCRVGDGDLEIEMPPNEGKIHLPNRQNPAPIFATMTRRSFPFETCLRPMNEIKEWVCALILLLLRKIVRI